MKKNIKYFPLLFVATLALGVLIGVLLNSSNENYFSANNTSKTKLSKLIDFIDNEYVDDVNTDSIVNITVDNILGQLDPHSVYMPPSEQAQVAENMKGDFVGIGVNFYMYNDSLAIIKPVDNVI
jgi:carboxyl-terminal processing protease